MKVDLVESTIHDPVLGVKSKGTQMNSKKELREYMQNLPCYKCVDSTSQKLKWNYLAFNFVQSSSTPNSCTNHVLKFGGCYDQTSSKDNQLFCTKGELVILKIQPKCELKVFYFC